MAELLYINSSGTDGYGIQEGMVGQMVTPDADWEVTSIWYDQIYTTGGSSETAEIYADTAGSPSGTALATSDLVAIAASVGGPETFAFDPGYVLLSGVSYWFIVSRMYILRTTTNPYAGGGIGYTTHSSDPTDNWTNNATFDTRQFKVNGELYVAPSLTSGRRGFTSRSAWRHKNR